MPHDVTITNEQTTLEIDEEALRATVDVLMRLEGVPVATVGIAIVDDPTIHVLNREHLAHDYPTDVLSWALHGPGEPVEGEVVVSADTAIARAGEFDWSPHDELLLYIVHGLLHVVGYDDGTAEERERMRSRERAVLRERGIDPRYHGDDGPSGSASSPPGES